jgi:hypothetical protein
MAEWTSAEHVGKVTTNLMDILAREFYKEDKKPDGEKDHSILIKLSQACGYQAQLYAGLQKNIEQARRLDAIEKRMSKVTPEDLALKNNPVILAEAELKQKNELR